MKIGGFQPFTLIDYPGLISAIIFTQGCNFRCPYCHNPELVLPERFGPLVSEKTFFHFLDRRTGKIDAVSITGGEPLIQSDLIDFIARIKARGFMIKVDTNGSVPDAVEDLLNRRLVDFWAMDVKAPLERYGAVAGVAVSPDDTLRSINLIKASGIEYEFRTTLVKGLLNAVDLLALANLLAGASHLVLQRFVPSKHVNERYRTAEPFSNGEIEEAREVLAREIARVSIR